MVSGQHTQACRDARRKLDHYGPSPLEDLLKIQKEADDFLKRARASGAV